MCVKNSPDDSVVICWLSLILARDLKDQFVREICGFGNVITDGEHEQAALFIHTTQDNLEDRI